jgi:6,7-dimethyl-8-ribityllumazine synthase
MNLIKADLVAKGKKFAVVISRFNEFVSSSLLDGCVDTLTRHGASENAIDTCNSAKTCQVKEV